VQHAEVKTPSYLRDQAYSAADEGRCAGCDRVP
jgi:hypothetical protein